VPTLKSYQIYALARWAGLSQSRARIATAVALCESEGNTDAHNTVPPDDSYGLWQINMLGTLGPARRASLGLKSNDELLDPLVNAKAMARISGFGLNFGPWTCYTSKKYEDHLADVDTSSEGDIKGTVDRISKGQKEPGFGSITPGSPIDKTVGALAHLDDAAKWLSTPHNWWRIAGVVAGGTLIIIALVTILQPVLEPATRAAVKAASRGLV
jgi:Lysozyme like domain